MNTPKDKSLAYHLLFPLLRLPKTSLGSPENLLNVYLSQASDTLVVEVGDRTQVSSQVFSNPNLVHDYFCGESQWFLFHLPQFTPELHHFREGKYSQFSDQAKALFRDQWSKNYGSLTLPVEETLLYWSMSSTKTTAVKYWVEKLDVDPSILPQELYYLPNPETEFITL